LNYKIKNFHEIRDTCNAYIVMDTPEGAYTAACKLNATIFEEKHLRCDFCGKKESVKLEGDSIPTPVNRDYKRCVFVGNVPFDVKDEAMWQFFAEVGDIEYVRVIRDRKLCIGKGFAYGTILPSNVFWMTICVW
jgi:nucleolar protein 12